MRLSVFSVKYSPVATTDVGDLLTAADLDRAVVDQEELFSTGQMADDPELPPKVREWAQRLVKRGVDTISISW